ncbi:MAG: Omp28 family outer membrane lipoprotein [Bacteroidales bacterium]|nr:Omp28 family outer membrane lipoprotein [Bacteroidales bacterium]
MKKIFYSLFACLFLFIAGCDKIEEDNYLIYSGSSVQWYNGSGVADKSQRTLLEKYTGVRCVNCPTADVAISAAQQAYNGQLIAVAIHDSSLAFCRPIGNSPDLRTEDGNTWSVFFGISSEGTYPMALVGRNSVASSWDIFTPTSNIESHTDAALAQNPSIALAVNAAIQGDTAIMIDVDIEYLTSRTDSLTLTLFIMEDGIVATQRQPDGTDDENYIHNHVLRDVITDPWGIYINDGRSDSDISANNPVAAGTKRLGKCLYTAVHHDWILSNCHIVAFVSEKSSKRILNVAECEIE